MKNPTKKRGLRFFLGMAVLCLWVFLSVVPVRAADKYWNVDDGDWNVGTNWDPTGVPVDGDKAYLTSSDAVSRTIQYYNTDTDMYLNSLRIDATGAGTMALDFSGAASVLTAETINVVGTGEMHLADGSVSAGSRGLTNQGLVTMAGATVSGGGGGLTNQALLTLSGAPNIINDNVVNYGTIKATDTTVTFTGTYTENGIYMSDPSVNNFNDWVIGTSGVVGGGIGDIFNVAGDFINNSLMSGLWDTDQASLCLTGEIQEMALAGAEMGALFSGYDNNFAWGEFSLESGVNLEISDGNFASGAALYVGLVAFEDELMGQLARIFSDYNIYYNAGLLGNGWLGGLTYDLAGSGQLIAIGGSPPPVPVPGAVWLLGSGLIGLLGLRRKFKK